MTAMVMSGIDDNGSDSRADAGTDTEDEDEDNGLRSLARSFVRPCPADGHVPACPAASRLDSLRLCAGPCSGNGARTGGRTRRRTRKCRAASS